MCYPLRNIKYICTSKVKSHQTAWWQYYLLLCEWESQHLDIYNAEVCDLPLMG